jgi:hypothetical protein
MRIASQIARYLLGLIFLVFGLTGCFHLLHMPGPTGVAAQFFGTIFVSHFYVVIFLLQIVSAVLVYTVGFCALSTMKLLPVIRAARSETRNPTISILPSNYAAAFMNSLWIVQDFFTTVWLW